jgi:hypothetical protein
MFLINLIKVDDIWLCKKLICTILWQERVDVKDNAQSDEIFYCKDMSTSSYCKGLMEATKSIKLGYKWVILKVLKLNYLSYCLGIFLVLSALVLCWWNRWNRHCQSCSIVYSVMNVNNFSVNFFIEKSTLSSRMTNLLGYLRHTVWGLCLSILVSKCTDLRREYLIVFICLYVCKWILWINIYSLCSKLIVSILCGYICIKTCCVDTKFRWS